MCLSKKITVYTILEFSFAPTNWCFLKFCFVVHGLEHAIPGRFLHHAGGEETAEDAQLALPEGLRGPAWPPYCCQKHMGALQPQREMNSRQKGLMTNECTDLTVDVEEKVSLQA